MGASLARRAFRARYAHFIDGSEGSILAGILILG